MALWARHDGGTPMTFQLRPPRIFHGLKHPWRDGHPKTPYGLGLRLLAAGQPSTDQLSGNCRHWRGRTEYTQQSLPSRKTQAPFGVSARASWARLRARTQYRSMNRDVSIRIWDARAAISFSVSKTWPGQRQQAAHRRQTKSFMRETCPVAQQWDQPNSS